MLPRLSCTTASSTRPRCPASSPSARAASPAWSPSRCGHGILEIVTINALNLYQGIGTLLIEAVRAEAKRLGCHEVTLTTTNDNIGALRFYQRRGFRLAALRPGAVDRSRQHKPEIPRTGDFGIPLRDEIDLSCPV